jgi:hypothetical protein
MPSNASFSNMNMAFSMIFGSMYGPSPCVSPSPLPSPSSPPCACAPELRSLTSFSHVSSSLSRSYTHSPRPDMRRMYSRGLYRKRVKGGEGGGGRGGGRTRRTARKTARRGRAAQTNLVNVERVYMGVTDTMLLFSSWTVEPAGTWMGSLYICFQWSWISR